MILSQITINVSFLFPPYRLLKSYSVVLFSLQMGKERNKEKNK